ncbi:hypothetical protein SLOPH_1160 [Spraguea lophii 42_110]|uniref:Uncharacterized protein n=1 Tax=Spraguea lophii (strain 42_110) TaxID=1358809 RepID=S7W6L0_SPRLO|nr:hypothetical protein SLOPH_1160 [Spraguea lophii 42_110]
MFNNILIFFLSYCLSARSKLRLFVNEKDKIVNYNEKLKSCIKKSLAREKISLMRIEELTKKYINIFRITFDVANRMYINEYDKINFFLRYGLARKLTNKEASENIAYKILYVIKDVFDDYDGDKTFTRSVNMVTRSKSMILTWAKNFILDNYTKGKFSNSMNFKSNRIETSLRIIIHLYEKNYRNIEPIFSNMLNSMKMDDHQKKLLKKAINDYNKNIDKELKPITYFYTSKFEIKHI